LGDSIANNNMDVGRRSLNLAVFDKFLDDVMLLKG